MRRSKFSTRSTAAIALAILLSATACAAESKPADSTSSAAPAESSQIDSDASTGVEAPGSLASLAAKLKSAAAIAPFEISKTPIDVSQLRGKKVLHIPTASTPLDNAIKDGMKAAADSAGVQFDVCTSQGEQSQYAQCLTQGLANKVDAIALQPNPAVLGPQLQALKNAGVAILSLSYFGEGVTPESSDCEGCAGKIDAVQPGPFREAGELMADWIIVDSAGAANVLVPTISGFEPTPIMEAAISKEFDEHCPGCTYKFVQMSLQDAVGSKFGTLVSSNLTGDSSINYVLGQFDLFATPTISAINSTGRSGVKVTGFNGIPDALSLLGNPDSPFKMDAGEPAEWMGYEAMDSLFRLMLDKPTEVFTPPLRVWTAENVAEAGDPPEVTQGYGTAYVDGYRKAWGISGS